MLSHRVSGLLGLILLVCAPITTAQCLTNQNPYCAGNADFEKICCTYPNVCYWADRQGTPACCPAGQVCIDRGGITIAPQPIVTITPTPTTVQPTIIYTTTNPPPPQTQTIIYTQSPSTQQQHTCCEPAVTTITEGQPTQNQPTTTITTTGAGGIGSTVIATASDAIVIFEGSAAEVRPLTGGFLLAGAVIAAIAYVV